MLFLGVCCLSVVAKNGGPEETERGGRKGITKTPSR